MRRKLALGIGILMIAGGLLGVSMTFAPSDGIVAAQEQPDEQQSPSEAHERMHTMMDMMMCEGASERMHAAMPGSEQMMETCVSGMGNMMNGMDGMMNGGMMDDETTNEQEEE